MSSTESAELPTRSSLDALNTDYVVDFLTPQVQTWEEEIAAKLLTDEERAEGLFVRFVLQGLLRGDVSPRIAYYSAGYRDGWLSQNDIRDLEDMNPIEDPAADEYRVQAQMTKLEDAGAKPKALPQGPPKPLPPEDEEEEDAEAAWRSVRVEADALRPLLLHTATVLARKEGHEVEAALKKNAQMVGSLGTFTVLYDLSKAAEMEGVQVHVVSTGERKGAAAPGTPVTDEDLAEAQRLVDGFDAFFRAAVKDGRELGGREASAIWTGAVWLAGEAKALGLVDRVETLDAAVERLAAPLRAKAAKACLYAG